MDADIAACPAVGGNRQRGKRHVGCRGRDRIAELVVDAGLGDLLDGGMGAHTGYETRRATRVEGELPAEIADIVVFELGRPIAGECVFEAGAEQKADRAASAAFESVIRLDE